MNNATPTLTPAGYLFPSPIGDGGKINPNFGAIRGIFYQGNSFYHALLVGVQKRMSRSFRMQGSFTWGKSIDTGSATVGGDQFGNSILNHPKFAVPTTPDNTNIFDSTGAPVDSAGLLTSTTTTAREIQFALKVVW